MKLALILLLLTGCSRGLAPIKFVSIEPQFKADLAAFIDEAKGQGRSITIDNLIIRFSDKLDSEILGECMAYNQGRLGTPTILINYKDYLSQSLPKRKVILFHELGHCVLWREHTNIWLPNGIVSSIMYPYDQEDWMYLNNWNYYMQELFHN